MHHIIHAARIGQEWRLTARTLNTEYGHIRAPRLCDADKALAPHLPTGDTFEVRLATPTRRAAEPFTVTPAPKHKSRRGGSGRGKLR
jgi:hypothetical protein